MGYQLPAHDVWWRVVEVLHIYESEDGSPPRLSTGKIVYRKTYEGALNVVEKWKGKHSAMIQGGIVTWYPDDELQAAYDATDWTRTQNYDDRDEYEDE
jgi:hypothetical protein